MKNILLLQEVEMEKITIQYDYGDNYLDAPRPAFDTIHLLVNDADYNYTCRESEVKCLLSGPHNLVRLLSNETDMDATIIISAWMDATII